MGFMDDMKDKMGDMDKMKARYDELKQKEQNTGLDEKSHKELNALKSRFEQ